MTAGGPDPAGDARQSAGGGGLQGRAAPQVSSSCADISSLRRRLVSEVGEIQESIGLLNSKLREAQTSHQVSPIHL